MVRGRFVGELVRTHHSSTSGPWSLGLLTAVHWLLLIEGRRGNRLPLPPLLCVRLLCCQKGAVVCKWAQTEAEVAMERSRGLVG